jgi:predicted P-loop ATPase
MTKEIELQGSKIEDKHDIFIKDLTQENNFIGNNLNIVSKYVDAISRQNSYHPVKIYLDNLTPLNSLDEFDKLCSSLVFEDVEYIDFQKLLIKKWLISAVAAIYDTRFKSQGVLVLQGDGNIGKSTWFANLVPNIDWFGGEITGFSVENKDKVAQITKYWIGELAELEGTFKKDYISLKGFITAEFDEYRAAYAHRSEKHKRKTIFCGSVNSMEYLKDETGNRKYWTISVKNIDWDIVIDLDKLWSEIKYCFLNGEKYNLNSSEVQNLNSNNALFTVKSSLDDALNSFIDYSGTVEKTIVSASFFQPLLVQQGFQIEKVSSTKIGIVLKNLGFKSERYRKNGVRDRWYNIPLKNEVKNLCF